jgi:hypothetical protein
METNVSPAGRASVTVTRPLEGPAPGWLVTATVYAPDCPTEKLPECVEATDRLKTELGPNVTEPGVMWLIDPPVLKPPTVVITNCASPEEYNVENVMVNGTVVGWPAVSVACGPAMLQPNGVILTTSTTPVKPLIEVSVIVKLAGLDEETISMGF